MKLLLDENLSRRLIARISDLFPDSKHVCTESLLQATDIEVWEFARLHGFAILTADGDYYELATKLGPPPKVVWLRGCDYPTAIAESIIRSQAIRISEFLKDEETAVLIVEPLQFTDRG